MGIRGLNATWRRAIGFFVLCAVLATAFSYTLFPSVGSLMGLNTEPVRISPSDPQARGLGDESARRSRKPLAALRASHKAAVDEIEAFLVRLGFTVEEISTCTVNTRFGRQHDDSAWSIKLLEGETWLAWDRDLGAPSHFRSDQDYQVERVCRAIKNRNDALTQMREIVEPYFSRDSIDEQFLSHHEVNNTWVLEPFRDAEFGMYYQGPAMVLDASTGCFLLIHFRVRSEPPVCESNIDIETGRRRAEDFALDFGVWPVLSKFEENRVVELYPGFERHRPLVLRQEDFPTEILGTERCVYVIRVYGVRDGRWTDLAPVELDVFVDRATGLALYAEYPIRPWSP